MSNDSGIQSGGLGDDGGQFQSPFQPFQKSGGGGGLFQPFQPVQKSGDGGGLFHPVQKSGDGGGLFRQVQRGSDFFDNLPHCRDDGERIELFLTTAQRPDVPLKAIEELLKYKDQFCLAMALQSFGYIAIANEDMRTKLANLRYYIDGLDDPREEIAEQINPQGYKLHSLRIFEKLCQEAQSGSELTRCSAAWSIQQLKYPPKFSTQFLFKSAEDIQGQMISENLKRLNDRHSLNDPSQYKEFIDFWVYAPKNHLLQLLQSIPANSLNILLQSIPANSLNIVESILARLGVAGVEFVTQTYGLQKFILEAGLRSADSLFRDTRYQDYQTKEKLSNALIPFLNNTDIDLRRLAAQPINEVGSWLNIDIRAKAAVISRDWNGNIVRLGEASVPFLLQALRGSLILDIRDNRGDQVKAVQSIGTIYAVNVDKKIINLVEFLKHREEAVRDATVSLLKQHKDRLDQNSLYILTALDFKFRSLTANFNYSIVKVEKKIISTRQYQKEIERIFQNAILSCNKENATEVSKFLSSKQKEYDRLLCKHIESLEDYKLRLQWEAADSLKQKIEETVRFVIDCTIMVIAIIVLYIYHPLFLSAIQNIPSNVLSFQNPPPFMGGMIHGPVFLLAICILTYMSVIAETNLLTKIIFLPFVYFGLLMLVMACAALFFGGLVSIIKFIAGGDTEILYLAGFIIGIILCILIIGSLMFVIKYTLKEIIFMFRFIIKKLRD